MSTVLDNDTLAQVFAQTLEDAAFVFVELDNSPQPFDGDVVHNTVSFTGPKTGTVLLGASTGFAVDLAANLLGLEPDDPGVEEAASEALSEVLNIAGGILLGVLFESNGDYRMGIPECTHVPSEQYDKQLGTASHRVSFLTDEGHRVDAAAFIAEAA